MNLAEMLADQLNGSRDWTLRLIADLKDEQWTFQPRTGLAHPLWLCGHLAVAEHLLVLTRCLGRGDPDQAFAEHFPIGGPIKSTHQHDYPGVDVVLNQMDATHGTVLTAIRGMSEAQLAEPCGGKDGAPHPHYKTKWGAIAHAARHEGFHAGQLAMLRRLMGKSFLR